MKGGARYFVNSRGHFNEDAYVVSKKTEGHLVTYGGEKCGSSGFWPIGKSLVMVEEQKRIEITEDEAFLGIFPVLHHFCSHGFPLPGREIDSEFASPESFGDIAKHLSGDFLHSICVPANDGDNCIGLPHAHAKVSHPALFLV